MGIEFIGRTLRTSSLILLITFPFLLYYTGLYSSLSFLSGAVWGVINLMLLTSLVQSVIRPDGVQAARAIIVALVKFPLLYGCGFLLMKIESFDLRWILAGASLSLTVVVLKAAGRLIVKADQQSKSDSAASHTPLASKGTL